ncbi:hypothetical protein, variant [Aphanomyces astaci]|uniref:Uncharacterized bromodomain-containing protein 10 helical domain-containing protein n=1 Tax=Aphanomyces astaci TaxID=112090 RepID=W4FR62_APHAT|nr:hypothetical protein, variant [Aphanomyces astaci]ETV69977.1 hypothetical protein, variant [Aphanomyces astaci]|eukprot:XP_009840420.1 hypothetical protein, variant [Aphanomyces astaci]
MADPSLMLWEKRKRVKPTLFQVEVSVKKAKVAAPQQAAARKSTRQTPSRGKKPTPEQPSSDDDDDEQSSPSPAKEAPAARVKQVSKAAAPSSVPRDASRVSEGVLSLIGQPFYDEDMSDWHGTNVHLDELAELRGMWQLPAACHILWLLQQPLKLKVYNSLREYEAALLNPSTSAVLEDVFTKLLLGKKERERLNCGLGLAYDWWSQRLAEYYTERYKKWTALKEKAAKARQQPTADDDDDDDDDDDVTIGLSEDDAALLNAITTSLKPLGAQNPLEASGFKDVAPSTRCKLLLNLCETVLQQPGNLDYIREMQDDDLRITPIGVDRCGNQYFFYPQFYLERRIYRLSEGDKVWQLWAKGLESVQAMHDAFVAVQKGRKWAGEALLLEHTDAMLELMRQDKLEAQKNEDKALKRAILEAMPRKRSARIQVKALEKFEDEKLKSDRAMADEATRAGTFIFQSER